MEGSTWGSEFRVSLLAVNAYRADKGLCTRVYTADAGRTDCPRRSSVCAHRRHRSVQICMQRNVLHRGQSGTRHPICLVLHQRGATTFCRSCRSVCRNLAISSLVARLLCDCANWNVARIHLQIGLMIFFYYYDIKIYDYVMFVKLQ